MSHPLCFKVTKKISDAIDIVLSRSSLDIEDKKAFIEYKNSKEIPISYVQKLSVQLNKLSTDIKVEAKWVHELLEGSEFSFPEPEIKEPVCL